MKTIGEIIRGHREEKGMLLRQLAALLEIDSAILSKIERGERKATKEQIIKIADILGIKQNDMLIQYLSEKIAYEIADEETAKQVLKVAEKKVDYIKNNRK
ncbi:MAG TPA: helix-turn-helix transcriptional regulator [Flavobacterium sp.]|jgi:transcriptional regulator with XRE-family HTH domain|nr:helix-turn-helix transcriptional regulator [Flavobacterium sp.]